MVMVWMYCHNHEAAFKAGRLTLRVGFYLKVARSLGWCLAVGCFHNNWQCLCTADKAICISNNINKFKIQLYFLEEFWLCIRVLLFWKNKDESEPLLY